MISFLTLDLPFSNCLSSIGASFSCELIFWYWPNCSSWFWYAFDQLIPCVLEVINSNYLWNVNLYLSLFLFLLISSWYMVFPSVISHVNLPFFPFKFQFASSIQDLHFCNSLCTIADIPHLCSSSSTRTLSSWVQVSALVTCTKDIFLIAWCYWFCLCYKNT